MPAISGVLGGFESILQRGVMSWAGRRNIVGKEASYRRQGDYGCDNCDSFKRATFPLRSISIYLYSIIYIII